MDIDLRSLDISNTAIEDLEGIDFSGFTNLEYVKTEESPVNPTCEEEESFKQQYGINENVQIQTYLETFFSCKRLFTGSGPFGCASNSRSGDYGKLFSIATLDDLAQLESSSLSDRAVLVNQFFFHTTENLIPRLLSIQDKIAILFVLDENETQQDISTSFISNSSLLSSLISFPIAQVSPKESLSLSNLETQNPKRPNGYENDLWQISALFDFYNGQNDVTTEFCLSEERCDPVGGLSVYGSLGGSLSSEKPIVLITVPLDAEALFHDLSFGANTAAASLTVFLSVAEAIRSSDLFSQLETFDKQILLAAFQGESFAGIGSTKWIFDLTYSCTGSENEAGIIDSCTSPLIYSAAFTDISMSQIEQVLSFENLAPYFLENPNDVIYEIVSSTDNTDFATLLSSTLSDGDAFEVVNSGVDLSELRANSARNFTVEAGLNSSAEVTVIKGLGTNPYYATRFDRLTEQTEENTEVLQTLASRIASAVLNYVAEPAETISVEANLDFITKVEHCLTIDFSCDLVLNTLDVSEGRFEGTFQGSGGAKTNLHPDLPSPPLFYAGIYRSNLIQSKTAGKAIEFFIRNMLSLLSSPSIPLDLLSNVINQTEVEVDLEDCLNDVECGDLGNFSSELGEFDLNGVCQSTRRSSMACVAGKCVCSTIFYHDAFSFGLERSGSSFAVRNERFEGMDQNLASGDLLLTEPIYTLPSARTFQQSNSLTEGILGFGGLITTGLTWFFLKGLIKKFENTKYKLA
eukprot:augustus_masked-scaffold_17-processed-gene-3.0-mRNA-1 protein AED:1.00 eAED:1.00 QI:0/0/0/0/1/1/2/0/747